MRLLHLEGVQMSSVLAESTPVKPAPTPPKVVSGFQRPHENIVIKSTVLPLLVEGVDLRPKMMKDNTRAQLFPDVVDGVMYEIRASLVDVTMDEIQNIEMYTDRQCHRKRVISAVKKIEPQSTPLFSPVLGKSLLLGSEEWDVKACTQTRKYRVDYYSGMGGDFLYSAVTPSSYQQYAPYLYYRFNSFASKLKKQLTSSSDE